MPVSMIDWPCDNTERKDIFLDPFIDRWDKYNERSSTPFYKDEMAYLRWNADPFFLQTGSGFWVELLTSLSSFYCKHQI